MRRELVQRAMAHDHEAFSELARLSVDRLHAIARLILRDPERAEDATQEAILLCWRDIGGLRDPDRFEPWMRRILVNACYREARRDRDRRRVEAQAMVVDPVCTDVSAEVAARDALERGFRRLDPEQRALIVLHHHLGLPHHEIAEVLRLPVGTVKSRLHRSTQALRAWLDADARDRHRGSTA